VRNTSELTQRRPVASAATGRPKADLPSTAAHTAP